MFTMSQKVKDKVKGTDSSDTMTNSDVHYEGNKWNRSFKSIFK